MERYDAAVIGAGPAGSTMAGLLARAGWSVAVIEKAAFPRRKVCGEFVSATNAAVLSELGLEEIMRGAGPAVRRVGFFARDSLFAATMPAARRGEPWGRALGREQLDTLLLRRAAALGATVLQPWAVTGIERDGAARICILRSAERQSRRIAANVVIAAHGSWDAGGLATQTRQGAPRASDLFGFKAHFTGADLADGLMPMLVFPGGYGGMVATDGGRVSVSCCVPRDELARLRHRHPGLRAGDAVLAHIRATTAGVRQALRHAALDGPVLGAGPIRPGIGLRVTDGVFLVGNAAGEAHPIVAEGISMAMQSAHLLAAALAREPDAFARGDDAEAARRRVGDDYSRRWWRAFAPRIHVAGAVAALALRAPLSAAMRRVVAAWPGALTAGAYLAGKTKLV